MTKKKVFKFLFAQCICILFLGCSKSKDNTVFMGYQKGVRASIDTTSGFLLHKLILQDSINSVFETSMGLIGTPELYGEKNKSGIRSIFNFNTDPIELNMIVYDNDGQPVADTIKYFVQFIGKDTLQMTKNEGKKENENYFTNKNPIFTFIKTDTISAIPQEVSDIAATIYKLYSNFSYNIAAMDNIDTDKIPVYGNLLEISFGLSMMRVYTMNYSFAAKDIQIMTLTKNEAIVRYNLIIMESDDKSKKKEITTKLKKINNQWRMYWKDILGKDK